MKSKAFTIKLMSMAIAAATAFSSAASLSLTNTASAADTDTTTETQSTLPTSLQNGDFESPGIQGILDNIYWQSYYYNNKSYTVSDNINYTDWSGKQLYPEIITYRNNDAWFVTSKTIFDEISDNKFYWETTDYNQRIELALGTQGMQLYFGDDKAGASSGSQFAELVPEKKSSLYQSISTEPGKVLSWSVDHRARTPYQDIMAVFIGPKQEYLQKTSDDANDIFMEMAELLESQYTQMGTGSQIGPIKLYSKSITEEDHIITPDSVSTTKSNTHTEEWQCWIVKSNYDKWYTYSGTYTVPENQEETTLAFTAMTSHSTNTEEGNCLDNIRLGELYPLTLTSMPGGTGSMEPNDKGSAAVNVDGDTTDDSKSQLYEKGEQITISATPKGNYIFTGAIVNGNNIAVDQFTENNGTYTYDITINQTYTVILTFAQKGYITYDANGGILSIGGNSDKTTYSHEFAEINETLRTPPTATYDNRKFLGWRLFAANEDGVQVEVPSELIPAGHSVKYSLNDSKAELTISWSGENGYESKTLSASQEDAVLLLAVYEHRLSVIPMTRYIGETSYQEWDTTGGTVKVKNNDKEDSTEDIQCMITAGNEYTINVYPKNGFRLDRLYYYDVSGRTIPLELENDSYTATFTSNRNVTVYAEFGEIPINAHYSFVPENTNEYQQFESFVKDPSNNPVGDYSGNYGGEEYGNTISTGFFTTRQFSTPSHPSGIWTIQIPENGTYFKIPDGSSASDIGNLELDTAKSLKDSDAVKNNKGTIYAVQDKDGENNLKLQMFVESDTTISGDGSVQFGLIIDNLYAPNATAGFKETNEHAINIIELDESNSIYTSDKNYEHDEDKLNLKSTITAD